jgi:hypothetical protein
MSYRIIQTPEQVAHAEANKPGPAVEVVRFYDRGARVWTAYAADAKGNQVSDAEHAHRKEWLPATLNGFRFYGAI